MKLVTKVQNVYSNIYSSFHVIAHYYTNAWQCLVYTIDRYVTIKKMPQTLTLYVVYTFYTFFFLYINCRCEVRVSGVIRVFSTIPITLRLTHSLRYTLREETWLSELSIC